MQKQQGLDCLLANRIEGPGNQSIAGCRRWDQKTSFVKFIEDYEYEMFIVIRWSSATAGIWTHKDKGGEGPVDKKEYSPDRDYLFVPVIKRLKLRGFKPSFDSEQNSTPVVWDNVWGVHIFWSCTFATSYSAPAPAWPNRQKIISRQLSARRNETIRKYITKSLRRYHVICYC